MADLEEYVQYGIGIEDIEILVFNFDGVLYSAPTIEEEYFEYLVKASTRLTIHDFTEADIRKMLTDFRVINCDRYDRNDIREHCGRDIGFLDYTYDRYRQRHFFWPTKSPVTAFSNDILRALSRRYKLYLLTDETMPVLEAKAKYLGVSLSAFTEIFAPYPANPDSYSHYHKYRQLININIIDGLELYSIGPNYHAHILPMLRNNGSGLHVNPCDCKATEQFLLKRFLKK